MKKTIFTLLLLAAIVSQGQAQEKKFWVGGSFNLSSSSGEEEGVAVDAKNNSVYIGPEFGYAFSDRWAAGMRLGILSSTSGPAGDGYDLKTNGFEIAPFAQYTLLSRKRFGVFVEGGLSYSHNYQRFEDGDVTSNGQDWYGCGASIEPGIEFNLTDCIALTGTFDFFNAGYVKYETGGYVRKDFSAELNSPFNLFADDGFFDNFMIGFEFKF